MQQKDDNPDRNHVAGDAEHASRPILGLSIPAQSTPKPDHFLLDLHETEAWFAALPLANVGETARQVYKTLLEFNRVEVADLLRAKIVEKFRPPVEYIADNLQRHYVDIGLPLQPKGWKTARLACELHKEMAISYKIIAQRMIAGDNDHFDRRLLVIALHRALLYQGQTLLQNALVYASWPEGIWREINSIYAYASQNGIHDVPVKPDDGRDKRAVSSIEDLFKGLVLFASATPYRLRQSHAQLLFSLLHDWSQATALLSGDDDRQTFGRFNVDLWADSPPMHNALRLPAPGKRIAVLDISELLEKLHRELQIAPWESRTGIQGGSPALTRPLLRQLILAWSRPPDRRFVRTRLNFELNVVAGLHAIYGNLRSDDAVPYSASRASVFKLDESDDPDATEEQQINWSSGSLDKATLSGLDESRADPPSVSGGYLDSNRGGWVASTLNEFARKPDAKPSDAPAEAASPPPEHKVQTLNESAGGYCIRWQGERIPRVKIGELIGVASPSEQHRYGLGAIRWIKQHQDQQLDLGLEVLSTRCQAGDVRAAVDPDRRGRSPSYKCLVINDTDPSSTATASLLMSAMHLDTGVDLWLTTGDRDRLIRLTQVIEFSSAFARYQFEPVRTDDDDQDSLGLPGNEFDDLWTSL